MTISIYDFLHRGYFPKELPPSFNTYLFALRYEEIGKKWNAIPSKLSRLLPQEEGESDDDYKERKNFYKDPVSNYAIYSITKGALWRRNLALLNPYNFLQLVTLIDGHKQKLLKFYDRSLYSQSKPTYEISISSRCYKASSPSVLSLLKKKLILSSNKKVEIKLDINNFYPSVYTHSITWAMVGKEKAKELWKIHGNNKIASPATQEEELYNLAYSLDAAIEHCQDKQTSGIPIGPDSSFMVAEILTTYIDEKIAARFHDIKACRYYDDYSLFVSSRDEAEIVVRYIQQVLGELELFINDHKLAIQEAPRHFLDDFSETLAPFKFNEKKVESSLQQYFNLLWKLCECSPNRINTIIRYGLKPLLNSKLQISPSHQELFESLLYKTALLDPSTLDIVQKVLTAKHITPTSNALTDLIHTIIAHHAPLHHHHEVAWSLWYCKKYTLPISKDDILLIFDMHNPICTLMLLDDLNNHPTLAAMRTDADIAQYISNIETLSDSKDLFGRDWILLYEGVKHGWLRNTAVVTSNPYFNYLYSEGISFYDDNINADYQSYDYIENLAYNVYPEAMRKEAKQLCTEVFSESYGTLFQDISDDDTIPDMIKEQTKKKCKDFVKDNQIAEDIFNRILSQIFHREDVDIEEYIKEVIAEVQEMLEY